MISFSSDYTEGCTPEILKRFSEINYEQLSGYGTDIYTESAKKKIRAACKTPDAEIHFLVGGTQTNRVVISSILKPYEGVVAATSGHVSIHEAGAIENSGHKVLTLPSYEGKIHADDLKNYLDTFFADDNHEHMVFPGMVYISYPTEYGTLYSKEELKAIHAICQEAGIPLYVDGARLGYGLMSKEADLTLPEFAELCDVFYIGGTKCGALLGEAVVFPRGNAPKHFMTIVKQEGALLAKGWVAALGFDTLFTDDLYFKICAKAVTQALEIKAVMKELGYTPFIDSPTNQQFFVLENALIKKIQERVDFRFWERADATHTVMRFVTSWATPDTNVEQLKSILRELAKR